MKIRHTRTLHSRQPAHRIARLSFWLLLAAGVVAGAIPLVGTVARRLRAGGAARMEPSQLRWLLTDNGERRGLAILSDLNRDAAQWELWANKAGDDALAPIDEFPPTRHHSPALFGFNGGYWDENEQPVGICAGEQGIHGARSHPNGFAIADGRAWIGPLAAHVRLQPRIQNTLTSTGLELQLNPKPAPRQKSFLVDPPAYSGRLLLPGPARICWLRRGDPGALHFNTRIGLTVRRVYTDDGLGPVDPPPVDTLLWVQPSKADDATTVTPRVGDRFDLDLALSPMTGVVRLATSAGPRLLRGGEAVKGLDRKDKEGNEERTWRTVIGCDATGRRLVAVLLARGKDGLPGVTLREAAQTLKDLGATEGLNLDGGSSTSAWSSKLNTEFFSLFPLQAQIHHALFLRRDLPTVPVQM